MERELTQNEKKAITALLSASKDKMVMFDVVNAIVSDKKGKKKPKVECVLIISRHRVYAIRKEKLILNHHLLDIEELLSFNANEVEFRFRDSDKGIIFETFKPDEIMQSIIKGFRRNFPSVALPFQLQILPKERVSKVTEVEKPTIGPCGGYTRSYKSVCNYMKIAHRLDLVWDIKNLLAPHGIKEFDLKEFTFANIDDFRSCTATLRYNRWFTSFTCQKKIPKEALLAITELFRYNTSFEELKLNNIGAGPQFFAELSDAFCHNKNIKLRALDFSNSTLDDKGAAALAKYLRETNIGLRALNISHCSLGKNGGKEIFEAIEKNPAHHNTLSKLVIGNNKFESDACYALGQALRALKSLKTFSAASLGSTKYEPMLGALKKINSVQQLDLSNNKVSVTSKSPQYSDWVGYFKSTTCLRELNFSNCSLAPESLYEWISLISGLQKLDVSNCELKDKALLELFEVIQKNRKSLKSLHVDQNFKPGKSKHREKTVEALITLLNNSDCKIETLSVAGGVKYAIKQDILPLLQSIGINSNLTSLNVSGHQFGDSGATALAKSIQQNTKLQDIKLDDNQITIIGYKVIVHALERNHSLQQIDTPLRDIHAAAKSNDSHLTTIQEQIDLMHKLLLRNQAYAAEMPLAKVLNADQREAIRVVLNKIDSMMGSGSADRNYSNEELEDQVKYLVGEEFLAKINAQATEESAKILFEKLYAQLDAIILLSSIDDKKPSEELSTPSPSASLVAVQRSPSLFHIKPFSSESASYSQVPSITEIRTSAFLDVAPSHPAPTLPRADSKDILVQSKGSDDDFYVPLSTNVYASKPVIEVPTFDPDELNIQPPSQEVDLSELPPEGKSLSALAQLDSDDD